MKIITTFVMDMNVKRKKSDMKIKIHKDLAISFDKFQKPDNVRKWSYVNFKATKTMCRVRVIGFKTFYIGIFGELLPYHRNPYYKLKAYFLGKYNERNFTNDKKRLKLWWNEVVLNKPVYYEYFSRDCDCYEVGGYGVAKNRKQFNESQEAMWESAEGECWMKRCSKAEYEANKDVRHERDRVMEAFENGNNFYV